MTTCSVCSPTKQLTCLSKEYKSESIQVTPEKPLPEKKEEKMSASVASVDQHLDQSSVAMSEGASSMHHNSIAMLTSTSSDEDDRHTSEVMYERDEERYDTHSGGSGSRGSGSTSYVSKEDDFYDDNQSTIGRFPQETDQHSIGAISEITRGSYVTKDQGSVAAVSVKSRDQPKVFREEKSRASFASKKSHASLIQKKMSSSPIPVVAEQRGLSPKRAASRSPMRGSHSVTLSEIAMSDHSSTGGFEQQSIADSASLKSNRSKASSHHTNRTSNTNGPLASSEHSVEYTGKPSTSRGGDLHSIISDQMSTSQQSVSTTTTKSTINPSNPDELLNWINNLLEPLTDAQKSEIKKLGLGDITERDEIDEEQLESLKDMTIFQKKKIANIILFYHQETRCNLYEKRYKELIAKREEQMKQLLDEEQAAELMAMSDEKKVLLLKIKKTEEELMIGNFRRQMKQMAEKEQFEELIVMKEEKSKLIFKIQKLDEELKLAHLNKKMKQLLKEERYVELIAMREEKNRLKTKIEHMDEEIRARRGGKSDHRSGILDSDLSFARAAKGGNTSEEEKKSDDSSQKSATPRRRR